MDKKSCYVSQTVLELSIELFVPNFICITAINLHSSVCYLSFALHLPPPSYSAFQKSRLIRRHWGKSSISAVGVRPLCPRSRRSDSCDSHGLYCSYYVISLEKTALRQAHPKSSVSKLVGALRKNRKYTDVCELCEHFRLSPQPDIDCWSMHELECEQNLFLDSCLTDHR
jgi:hypothetical protein